MHQDLLQLQACQNPFNDQKHKSLRLWYSEITLIDTLGHVDQKLPIFREYFWAIILSLNRNDINNFGPKDQPFKTILTWEKMLQFGRPSMKCIVVRSRQTMGKKKKKTNKTIKKMVVMSCTWKIRLSLNENQEAKKMLRKWWKSCINTNHSSPARNYSSV